MKALILAAGYGTRLYPLTKRYPKCLLPIAQRPILDYIKEKLARLKKIKEILIVTNERFFQNFLDWAGKLQDNRGLNIKVISDGTKTEKDRLGAIGDIYFALTKGRIDEDILIIGGDNLFEEDLTAFTKFALSKKPQVSLGVYDIEKKSLAGKYGVVKLGPKDSKVIDFREKPVRPLSSLIATCLYYIPREKLKYFSGYFKDPQNERDSSGSFIRWLSKEDDVYGYVFKKHWYDIGDPQVYKEADKVFSNL